MNKLSPQEEIILLRKKARRRLVGTIVLVALATAVLWKTLDHPSKLNKINSVKIINEAVVNKLPIDKALPTVQTAASVPLTASSDALIEKQTSKTIIENLDKNKKTTKANLNHRQRLKTKKHKLNLANERKKATAKLAEEQLKAEETLKGKTNSTPSSNHKKHKANPEDILNGL